MEPIVTTPQAIQNVRFSFLGGASGLPDRLFGYKKSRLLSKAAGGQNRSVTAETYYSRVIRRRAFLKKSVKQGVGEGTRTPDPWNHNPVLYQLSYAHHNELLCPRSRENGTLSIH